MRSAARPDLMFLADSMDRVGALKQNTELRFGLARGTPGWVNCADLLAAPAGFDRWRAELAGWMQDTYGSAPARATAGYVLSWYLFVPAYLGAVLFHHERRVPVLAPRSVAFRTASPRPHPDGIALLSATFACLPDDPAAGTQLATVVADEHALAALLRARYVAHAAQFLRAFAPTARFGKRTVWAAATDALDSSLWYAGRCAGDEGAGVADAGLVLSDRFAPLTSATTMRAVTDPDEHTCWTRRRESCCFHYLIAKAGGECETCPRRGPRG